VSFSVANTGKRAGAAVPQVYVADPQSPVPRPPKELKGFSKILLQPGESRKMPVVFVVDPAAPRELETISLSYTFFEVEGNGS